jgi:MSHA biogenesis protein MshL
MLRINRGNELKVKTLASILVTGAMAACASAGTRGPATLPAAEGRFHTTVTLDSAQSRQRADTVASLPVLSISQLSEGGTPVKRIQLLDAGNNDLPIVLRGLAESFGLNFQIDANVHGTVQTRLQDVTLEQALDAIVLPQGYTYSIDNGVLRVGAAKVQTKIFSLDYVAFSRFATTSTSVSRRIGGAGSAGIGAGAAGGGSDQISSVSVTDLWAELRTALVALIFDSRAAGDTTNVASTAVASGASAGVLPNGQGGSGAVAFSRVDAAGQRLIINPVAGTVLVTATPAKLAEVATFMQAFESSVQRQVLIEAKIVEVRLNNDFQFGIDWNRIASGPLGLGFQTNNQSGAPTVTLSLGGGSSKVNLVLHALQSQGDVSVLSSPRVAAMNNVRAQFSVTTDEVFFIINSTPITNSNGVVGSTQNVTPQTISVGIVLDVLPQIAADNMITMNIRPHVTSVVRTATFQTDNGGTISAPVVENRETDTMIRARAGETVVIGGLMQNAITHTTTGVPGLQSLPVVGGLFRGKTTNESKSELVIFITASIVAGQPATGY